MMPEFSADTMAPEPVDQAAGTPEINPATGKPYTMPEKARKEIGRRLAEARAAKAAERGAKPGSRNPISGKGTRPTRAAKAAAPRKTAAKPAENPAHVGAEKLSSWVRLGGVFMSAGDPVRGSIITLQAERLEPVLKGLADADDRVAQWLSSIGSFAGPASAWTDAFAWAGSTAAAVALTSGRVPGGLVGTVVAGLGGATLEAATVRVVLAERQAQNPGGVVAVDTVELDAEVRRRLAGYGLTTPQAPDATASG